MKPVFSLGALAAAALLACLPAAAADRAAPAATASGPAAMNEDGRRLKALADEYYDALARFDPVSASESGDNRFSDQIGMSISPAVRARQFALYHGYQKRLQAIGRDKLSPRDRTSYDILAYELATALRFES